MFRAEERYKYEISVWRILDDYPGSMGQKGTQSRIPDPDPQHCEISWVYLKTDSKTDF